MSFTGDVSRMMFSVIKNELPQYFQFLVLCHSKIPITQNILNCIFWKTIVPKVKKVPARMDVCTRMDKNNAGKSKIPKKSISSFKSLLKFF